jgi:hypothetical protein
MFFVSPKSESALYAHLKIECVGILPQEGDNECI